MRQLNPWRSIPRAVWVLLLGVALLGIAAHGVGRRWIVVNTSSSVAPGLYVRSNAKPAVGELVSFRMPEAARPYIEARAGRSGADWFLIKPIVAGPGDAVAVVDGAVRVNGARMASMPDVSGREPPVPVWEGSVVLGPDEFFVVSTRIENSFDSRCFGPIHREDIETVRRALVTW